MSEYHSLSHSKWDCKYHLVFIPKRRRKALFGSLRKDVGAIFKELAQQKGCTIVEGHTMPDHVHMCIEIPPKYAVSSVLAQGKEFCRGALLGSGLRDFDRRTRA